jgi:hypothetical protein
MTKCREGLENFGVFYKKKVIFYSFQTFLCVHVLIVVANGKLSMYKFFVPTCAQPNPNAF